MSACRDGRNKTVEVLPASSRPDFVLIKSYLAASYHLITKTLSTVMKQLSLYRKRIASVSGHSVWFFFWTFMSSLRKNNQSVFMALESPFYPQKKCILMDIFYSSCSESESSKEGMSQ